jgi:hypothetical protein
MWTAILVLIVLVWLLALLLSFSTRQLSNHFRLPPRASCLSSHFSLRGVTVSVGVTTSH